jgi:hypothetical protein
VILLAKRRNEVLLALAAIDARTGTPLCPPRLPSHDDDLARLLGNGRYLPVLGPIEAATLSAEIQGGMIISVRRDGHLPRDGGERPVNGCDPMI